METSKLKKFAQHARTTLIDTVKTKLDFVLADDSSARREHPEAVEKLVAEIANTSEEQVVEKIAYIWFNRFIALRFMDVNRYTKLNIVSPESGQFQPTILSDAKMGHVDDSLVSDTVKEKVLALLENRTPSQDPQGEAYKLLVVSACNYYSHAMPFLFERIADYTELLMPDDLLSATSILSAVREAMTPDVCKDVEVIGWLYQFYISEKKDKVFEGIKKNKKVTPDNIPAATQLFTPHWIVQYMVENSLGRLWMLNNPDSKLKMDYYIKPETPEDDYLQISSPTELKVCDPACGSGHILVYAFDLLFEIYKEAGFTDDATIIENILKHNLYGIEIDERAAELAAFALAMKAASRSGSKRRFFRNPIEVNICKLETVSFSDEEISSYMDAVGRDLFTSDLQTTLKQFEEADNFGSLIQPAVKDATATLKILKENRHVTQDMFLAPTQKKVLQVLEQADYLSQKYHVVVANPPFMGKRNQNSILQKFLSTYYKGFDKNLFSAFMKRSRSLLAYNGIISYVTPFTWLTINSYQQLRKEILEEMTILSLVKPSYTAFFEMATVQFVAFVLSNQKKDISANYYDLGYLGSAQEQPSRLKKLMNNPDLEGAYIRKANDFKAVPGFPIAFTLSQQLREAFIKGEPLKSIAEFKQGLATTDNNKFLRSWWETSLYAIGFNLDSPESAKKSKLRWFPYNKGGNYRKWFGNNQFIVNWQNDGEEIKQSIIEKYPYLNGNPGFVAKNTNYYFKPSVTWSLISSYSFGARMCKQGFVFDVGGSSAFASDENRYLLTGLLCSKLTTIFLQALNPTANMQVGDVASIPLLEDDLNIPKDKIISNVKQVIDITTQDWNSYEISWGFNTLPLIDSVFKIKTLSDSYNSLKLFWQSQIDEIKMIEEKNNKIFIEVYGLQDELDPEVPLKEITLTCNPYYRYDAKKSKEELDELQLVDTMKEYISYAVGVMLGRYSLDHDGLHIADVDVSVGKENEKFNIQTPTFEADDDNVIPILDGDWFTDDISERFLQFVKVTFGEESYEENVQFIEDAIGKSIRKYFVKDFYPDHVKRYKKRPIYWMFSSPKGSFQALIYIHRYKSDTVSVILNDYLRDYITKLEATKENLEAASISSSASKTEKTKAIKEIEKIKKMIIELVDYEKDIMYPLATQKIEIDLDDGVKHNYPLFGKALKKVTGLS